MADACQDAHSPSSAWPAMRARGHVRGGAGGRPISALLATLIGPLLSLNRALDGADAEGRDDGEHQIDQRGEPKEQERLLGDARSDVRLANDVRQSDRRHQRGILQQDQPEIRQAGQGDADQLRQDDQPHGLAAGQADRIAAFILAAAGSPGRPKGRPRWHRTRTPAPSATMPETKLFTSTRRAGLEDLHDLLQHDLHAEKDEEQRQKFGQAAEDRRVDVACKPQRRFARTSWQARQENRSEGRTAGSRSPAIR